MEVFVNSFSNIHSHPTFLQQPLSSRFCFPSALSSSRLKKHGPGEPPLAFFFFAATRFVPAGLDVPDPPGAPRQLS